MNTNLSPLDRRKFLRGAGVALALPWFESFTGVARAVQRPVKRKRLACFYLPDGVPMPLEKDPSFKDWSWFPHGKGKDFTFSKCTNHSVWNNMHKEVDSRLLLTRLNKL